MKLKSVFVVLSVALVALGCGADDEANDADEPAVSAEEAEEQLAVSLVEVYGVTPEQAACVAAGILERGLSEAALSSLVDAEQEFPEEERARLGESLRDSVAECTGPVESDPQESELVRGISASLVRGFGMSQEPADCAALRLVNSGVSDGALLAAVAGDPSLVPAAEVEVFKVALRESVVSCQPASQRDDLIASLMTEFGLTEKVAGCMATRLESGPFSDASLRAVLAGDTSLPAGQGDAFVVALGESAAECA